MSRNLVKILMSVAAIGCLLAGATLARSNIAMRGPAMRARLPSGASLVARCARADRKSVV